MDTTRQARPRFIVQGSFFDRSLSAHLFAANAKEALEYIHHVFGDDTKGYSFTVTNVDDDRPDMLHFWKFHGYTYRG